MPNAVPTIARQNDTSVSIILVREVSVAVCTYPVPITYTLEFITANLKSKIKLA
jgi:hypothetical protein